MLALVATRPAAEETANAYSECWTPIFGKYFSGDALYRLHNAGVAYIDSRSPDYLSYPRSPTRAAVASFR